MSDFHSNLLRIASDLPEGDTTRRKILAAISASKVARMDPADVAMSTVLQGDKYIKEYVTAAAEDLQGLFRDAAKEAETLEKKLPGNGWRAASSMLQKKALPALRDLEDMVKSIREGIQGTVRDLPKV